MKSVLNTRIVTIAALSVAFAGAFALSAIGARGPELDRGALERLASTLAEEAFADAPMGVDPMVTGPTTAAFEMKQRDLGCADAKWPDVPLGCFPD
jgi:hypothetical protein